MGDSAYDCLCCRFHFEFPCFEPKIESILGSTLETYGCDTDRNKKENKVYLETKDREAVNIFVPHRQWERTTGREIKNNAYLRVLHFKAHPRRPKYKKPTTAYLPRSSAWLIRFEESGIDHWGQADVFIVRIHCLSQKLGTHFLVEGLSSPTLPRIGTYATVDKPES